MPPKKIENHDIETVEDAQLLLEDVVRAMVDGVEDVTIEVKPDRRIKRQINIDIHVQASDVRFVIGSKGKMKRALETVFTAVYGRLGHQVSIWIPGKSENNRR